MIISENRIKSKQIKVRFYRYSDWEKGMGDAGSLMYAVFPLSAFNRVEGQGYSGRVYFTYSFTAEWYSKLKPFFGQYWHMDTGYEAVDTKKRKKELEDAIKIVEIVKQYKHFV